MSTKVLSNLDLNLNQILNLVLQQLASDPGSPSTGQIWYNTTTNYAKYYNGSASVILYPAASTNTATNVVLRDGSGNFSANIGTFNQLTINNSPVNSTDAATKSYVDNLIQGLENKPAGVSDVTIVATTAALAANTYSNGASGSGATLTFNATGVQTVDGHQLALNDYVLVKNEATQANNGLYKVTTAPAVGVAGVLTRDVSMATSAQYQGAFIVVNTGTTNSDTQWLYNGAKDPTVGTTAITFTQMPSASQYTFNAPLSVSGNTVSLNLNARLVNNSGNLDLASGIVTAGTYTSVTADTYGRVTAGADITSGTGIVTKTASGTFTARTITGTTNRLTVTNGDGVSGNPTLDISGSYVGQTSITTLGTITTGTWTGTTIAIANGGTGQTSASAAFNALSPMTTLGDLIYGGASGAGTRLAGNTTTTRNFLRQVGNGSVSAAPAWDTIQAGDLPASAALMYTTTITGNGATTAFTITHNLATQNISVTIRDSSNNQVLVDNQANASNTCVITFATAPANAVTYNVLVVG